jgi:hypothetical protein
MVYVTFQPYTDDVFQHPFKKNWSGMTLLSAWNENGEKINEQTIYLWFFFFFFAINKISQQIWKHFIWKDEKKYTHSKSIKILFFHHFLASDGKTLKVGDLCFVYFLVFLSGFLIVLDLFGLDTWPSFYANL